MKPRSSRPKNAQRHSSYDMRLMKKLALVKRSLMEKLASVKPIVLPVILGVGCSLVATAFLKRIGLIDAFV